MDLARTPDSPLLTADDGRPVEILNASGEGKVLLVCEHASNRMPAALGDLGLPPDLLRSHIAWDPGALSVARTIARELDAPLVAGRFSRLAYDCNRPPEAFDAVTETSEGHAVPGNRGLSPMARAERAQAIYAPFRAALAEEVQWRPESAIVTIHSFTPVYLGVYRPVELGVLHDSDARLADAVLSLSPQFVDLRTERNQPYGPQDGVTHTLREHALPTGALNVMLEVRNDLISQEADCVAVGEALASLLKAALAMAAEPGQSAGTGG